MYKIDIFLFLFQTFIKVCFLRSLTFTPNNTKTKTNSFYPKLHLELHLVLFLFLFLELLCLYGQDSEGETAHLIVLQKKLNDMKQHRVRTTSLRGARRLQQHQRRGGAPSSGRSQRGPGLFPLGELLRNNIYMVIIYD